MRLIDADACREDFMQEVYAELESDPDNVRANRIIDLFDMMPTIESPRDWTPCAEGLPEDDKVVLVTASHLPLYEGDSEYPDTVFEAYHIRGTWRNTIDLQMANTKILAWQPLPSPYRADDTTGKPDHIVDANKKVQEPENPEQCTFRIRSVKDGHGDMSKGEEEVSYEPQH